MLSSKMGRGARAASCLLLGIGLMGGRVGAVITLDLDDAGMFTSYFRYFGGEGGGWNWRGEGIVVRWSEGDWPWRDCEVHKEGGRKRR